MTTADVLVYGSYGYTGNLIAEAAVDRGLDVLVAGRNRRKAEDQAARLRCAERVFSLDEPKVIDATLEEVPVVLHCAGPFVDTYEPMVEGCLRTGTHYLDITGEIGVFEAISRRDDDAREAGVMLMPGVGFDVVPTDCLAAHLANRLPDATELALGFDASVGVSPGTAKTVVRNLDAGGKVRRDGRIVEVPTAWKTREVDFGDGEKTAMTIPWGDVSTAYHTTGIGNVEVYNSAHPKTVRNVRILRRFAPLLGLGPVQSALEWLVESRVEGPSEQELAETRSYVWGEARTEDGRRAVSRLETMHTYELTAHSALAAVERVLDGDAPVGYRTPGGAYGADFVLELPDTERFDEPIEGGDGAEGGAADGAERPAG